MMDMDNEQHDLRYLPIDSLVPNKWNPQHMEPETFERLVDEIAAEGFINAITVIEIEDEDESEFGAKYRIIGGEHRWRAAQSLGYEEIPCLIVQDPDGAWDEDKQKFITVRLNVLSGKIDGEKFIRLYEEMAGKYGKEPLQDLFAFTDKHAFNKLVAGVKEGMKEALPKSMHDEFDAAAKDARTVEDLDRIIREMFDKYGDTVQLSFMIFTFGKFEHIYVSMDRKMKRAMTQVMDYCRVAGKDINEVMAPIVKRCAKELEQKLAEARKDDDVDF